MTPRSRPDPTALAALTYLMLLPAGHLVVVPVAGALATGADLALMGLLGVWSFGLLTRPRRRDPVLAALRGGAVEAMPPRSFLVATLVLAALGGWIALSGWWGFHAGYALAKGLGTAAMALGALAIATSGTGWRRATDAWLAGSALALALTAVLALLGPGPFQERMVVGGAGVAGLPFRRLSGPFFHPNMLGDYLLVSGLLLWGRRAGGGWPSRGLGAALAVAMAGAFLLTVSTAWVGAGSVAVVGGWWWYRRGGRAPAVLFAVAGAGVALVTLAFVVLPLSVAHIASSAIRPTIWRGALEPFFERPLAGVGAAPYLAWAADPFQGDGVMGLWDAHNAYLSILGQFGLVGAGLALAGAWGVVRVAWASPASRARSAVLLSLLAGAVNALFVAGEDLRHVWAFVGLVGVLAAEGGPAPVEGGPPAEGRGA